MNYSDIQTARAAAMEDIEKANIAVRQAVSLIAGHLRSAECWGEDLVKLKRELQDFNSITRKWKEKQ